MRYTRLPKRHVPVSCEANEKHRTGDVCNIAWPYIYCMAHVIYALHGPCDGVLISALQMAKLRPEMEALQASVKGSGNMFSNPAATEAHTEKLRLLFKKHDVHPLKSFLGMFAQAPLFITFFWTLQNMAERNSSFTTGGFGQFMDLRYVVLHPRGASPTTSAAVLPTLPDGMFCRSSPVRPSWPTWSAAARCRWTTRHRRSRRR